MLSNLPCLPRTLATGLTAGVSVPSFYPGLPVLLSCPTPLHEGRSCLLSQALLPGRHFQILPPPQAVWLYAPPMFSATSLVMASDVMRVGDGYLCVVLRQEQGAVWGCKCTCGVPRPQDHKDTDG